MARIYVRTVELQDPHEPVTHASQPTLSSRRVHQTRKTVHQQTTQTADHHDLANLNGVAPLDI